MASKKSLAEDLAAVGEEGVGLRPARRRSGRARAHSPALTTSERAGRRHADGVGQQAAEVLEELRRPAGSKWCFTALFAGQVDLRVPGDRSASSVLSA